MDIEATFKRYNFIGFLIKVALCLTCKILQVRHIMRILGGSYVSVTLHFILGIYSSNYKSSELKKKAKRGVKISDLLTLSICFFVYFKLVQANKCHTLNI